jgi:Uma2 family endonuclease
METPRHREAMNHLIEATQYHWRNRPDDYYVGGNMFVYYSRQQVRNRDYRGPDFFIVDDVDGSIERQSWVVWEENGRYPDLIVELLSPSTTETDKTTKKRLYERTFRTHEYFCYDPFSGEFIGWRLVNNQYDRIQPNQQDRLWSEVLQAYLGYWEGIYQNRDGIWLRIFDSQGELIPTQVEAETQRANHEAQARQVAEERANEMEQQLRQLQAELAQLRK